MNYFRFDICPCCNSEKKNKDKGFEDPFSFDVDLSESDIDFIAETALKEMRHGEKNAP